MVLQINFCETIFFGLLVGWGHLDP